VAKIDVVNKATKTIEIKQKPNRLVQNENMLHDSSLMKRHARKGIKTCRYPGLVLDVVHMHLCREFLARYSSTHARACHLFGSVSAQRCSTDAESRGDCSYKPRLRRRRSIYPFNTYVCSYERYNAWSSQKI